MDPRVESAMRGRMSDAERRVMDAAREATVVVAGGEKIPPVVKNAIRPQITLLRTYYRVLNSGAEYVPPPDVAAGYIALL